MKKQDRVYLIDGIEYPRITSVIDGTSDSFGLRIWFREKAHPCKTCEHNGKCGIQEEALEAWDNPIETFSCLHYSGKDVGAVAADYGTAVHDQLFQYFTGNQIEKSPKNPFWVSIKPVIEWADKHKIEPVVMEDVVYSKKYGFAGRVDFIARIDGKTAIIDWKTSKELRWNYVVQACAYYLAWNEMHPDRPAQEIYIVRCPKISDPKEIDPDDPPEAEILQVPTNRIGEGIADFLDRLSVYTKAQKLNTPRRLREFCK